MGGPVCTNLTELCELVRTNPTEWSRRRGWVVAVRAGGSAGSTNGARRLARPALERLCEAAGVGEAQQGCDLLHRQALPCQPLDSALQANLVDQQPIGRPLGGELAPQRALVDVALNRDLRE